MVDYNLLNEMLESALANETCESWNERLDGGFADSQLIDVVSTLDTSSVCTGESLMANNSSWAHETIEKKSIAVSESNSNNDYAIAA